MCTIAVKYFKDVGFCGVKNRDRNYRPTVNIKQSYRNGLERMYIWDERTKYTEGLNEYGVCIISAAVAVKKDEKEGSKAVGPETGTFYSPDGKKIRTALLEKSVQAAADRLIDLELKGNTFVFDEDKCILIESDLQNGKYIYETAEIKKDEVAVRTNHGVMIKSGYHPDENDEKMQASWESTKTRYDVALRDAKKIVEPHKFLDGISNTENKNPQLNPLRKEERSGKNILQTTGQLLLIPKERCLYYRPVWCNMQFNFDKLDSKKSSTYFQILSSRTLFEETESFDELFFKVMFE